MATAVSLAAQTQRVLTSEWERILERGDGDGGDLLDDSELVSRIHRSISSTTKSYRYVLPTQLSAKVADHSLDAHCLQERRGGKGSFDARSVCHRIIVPFDRANHSVLGGSSEPYVNNPLRCPEVTLEHEGRQGNKAGWRDLCEVLDAVESRDEPAFTLQVLRQVLLEVYRRLGTVHVTYGVPARASLDGTLVALELFLERGAGGMHAQAVAAALLKTCGEELGVWCGIRTAPPNSADASSGLIADIECIDETGQIVLGAEVKDKELTLTHVEAVLPTLRERRVTEFLFLLCRGCEKDGSITQAVAKEFAAGHNLYILDLISFSGDVLALMGEKGRSTFLRHVGSVLDGYSASIGSRRAWAALLSSL